MDGFLKGQYDRVELVYNQFRNAAVQILTTEQLLPVPKAEKKPEDDKNKPADDKKKADKAADMSRLITSSNLQKKRS